MRRWGRSASRRAFSRGPTRRRAAGCVRRGTRGPRRSPARACAARAAPRSLWGAGRCGGRDRGCGVRTPRLWPWAASRPRRDAVRGHRRRILPVAVGVDGCAGRAASRAGFVVAADFGEDADVVEAALVDASSSRRTSSSARTSSARSARRLRFFAAGPRRSRRRGGGRVVDQGDRLGADERGRARALPAPPTRGPRPRRALPGVRPSAFLPRCRGCAARPGSRCRRRRSRRPRRWPRPGRPGRRCARSPRTRRARRTAARSRARCASGSCRGRGRRRGTTSGRARSRPGPSAARGRRRSPRPEAAAAGPDGRRSTPPGAP